MTTSFFVRTVPAVSPSSYAAEEPYAVSTTKHACGVILIRSRGRRIPDKRDGSH